MVKIKKELENASAISLHKRDGSAVHQTCFIYPYSAPSNAKAKKER